MSCEAMSERIPEWLAGELGERELSELREHLASCPGCTDDAAAFGRLWNDLGEGVELEPPADLRERFHARLAIEIAAERRRVVPITSARAVRGRLRLGSSLLRFAAAAAILASGVFFGSELAERRTTRAIAALREEMLAERESLALALLEVRSASERLRGVAYGRQLSAADGPVAAALFQALLHDPDVNVRLAALDVLAPRAAIADERPRLVAAVAQQHSPLVQLSLLDVLLATDRPAAGRDLEQLLDNPNLDPVVRGYLRGRLGRSL